MKNKITTEYFNFWLHLDDKERCQIMTALTKYVHNKSTDEERGLIKFLMYSSQFIQNQIKILEEMKTSNPEFKNLDAQLEKVLENQESYNWALKNSSTSETLTLWPA